MQKNSYIFTSESVGEGHPDKLCDRISDEIVDAYLKADPFARVACECLATTNYLCIAGETRGPESITTEHIEHIARQAVRDIGYAQEDFHWNKIDVDVRLHAQSPDIAQGVDAANDLNKDEGAGDQGIMFGYACRETESFMPAPIYYAHGVLKSLAQARRQGLLPMLGPDAKCQISLAYENAKPSRATAIVVSSQHKPDVSQQDLREIIKPYVMQSLPEGWMCADEDFFVNPTGRFVTGGPHGDCGLTGRKIIVDTYGGAAPHGGGAFSGKDPTKVDRSAAYMARYMAKNIVAAGLADRVTLQLSYAIGVSKPLSLYVDTHGTGIFEDIAYERALRALLDLSPRGIREHLNLNRPIYSRTAAYGHFGRSPDLDGGFSWEKTDFAQDLKTEMATAPYAPLRRSDVLPEESVRVAP